MSRGERKPKRKSSGLHHQPLIANRIVSLSPISLLLSLSGSYHCRQCILNATSYFDSGHNSTFNSPSDSGREPIYIFHARSPTFCSGKSLVTSKTESVQVGGGCPGGQLSRWPTVQVVWKEVILVTDPLKHWILINNHDRVWPGQLC